MTFVLGPGTGDVVRVGHLFNAKGWLGHTFSPPHGDLGTLITLSKAIKSGFNLHPDRSGVILSTIHPKGVEGVLPGLWNYAINVCRPAPEVLRKF
jgi:hypothetical protein